MSIKKQISKLSQRRLLSRRALTLRRANRALLSLPSLLSLLLAGILMGCESECEENHSALPLAGFYTAALPGVQIEVDSLEVTGLDVPGDSVLFSGSASQVYLPFRIDSDTTAYIFRSLKLGKSLRPDTVEFVYTRQPRLSTAACGVSYYYRMQQISTTGSMIDSVICPTGFIDNKNRENLQIYFSPTVATPPAQ